MGLPFDETASVTSSSSLSSKKSSKSSKKSTKSKESPQSTDESQSFKHFLQSRSLDAVVNKTKDTYNETSDDVLVNDELKSNKRISKSPKKLSDFVVNTKLSSNNDSIDDSKEVNEINISNDTLEANDSLTENSRESVRRERKVPKKFEDFVTKKKNKQTDQTVFKPLAFKESKIENSKVLSQNVNIIKKSQKLKNNSPPVHNFNSDITQKETLKAIVDKKSIKKPERFLQSDPNCSPDRASKSSDKENSDNQNVEVITSTNNVLKTKELNVKGFNVFVENDLIVNTLSSTSNISSENTPNEDSKNADTSQLSGAQTTMKTGKKRGRPKLKDSLVKIDTESKLFLMLFKYMMFFYVCCDIQQ